MKAVAVKGKIDRDGVLQISDPLAYRDQEVQVIILIPESDDDLPGDSEWLAGLTTNPAFDFLKDEAEDIYTLEDGKTF
jgi:hypothetical protein